MAAVKTFDIQIGGVQISDADICEITEYIKPLADSIFEQPTEFEMVTALGFEYFARQGCDLVVCEVGMGGEFDATNVILHLRSGFPMASRSACMRSRPGMVPFQQTS